MERGFPNLEAAITALDAEAEYLTSGISQWTETWEICGRSSNFGVDMAKVNPGMRELCAAITRAEDTTGIRFCWSSSVKWLELVKSQRQQTVELCRMVWEQQNCDMPAKLDAVAMNKVLDSHPYVKFTRTMYGPNWRMRQGQMSGLGLLTTWDPASTTPFEHVRPKIEDDVGVVLEKWRLVRDSMKRVGIEKLRDRWTHIPLNLRRCLLQQITPQLHAHTHSTLEEMLKLNYPALDGTVPWKGIFVSPFLNLDDLSDGTLLPDLLEARAEMHPRYFLDMDAASVRLGLYCGTLPRIRIAGAILLPYTALNSDSEYKIVWSDKPVVELDYVSPWEGMYRIRAQRRAYELLADLANALGDEDLLSQVRGSSDASHLLVDAAFPSDLEESIRSRLVSPAVIDSDIMQTLLQSWLNETLHDFRMVRTDPQVCLERMQATAQTGAGRTSHFLTEIFDRIDKFQALHEHVTAFCGHEHSIATLRPDDEYGLDQVKRVARIVSLHAAFRCVLSDAITILHKYAWRPGEHCSAVLARLLDMFQRDDAMLRMMNLDAVIQVVEREIQVLEGRHEVPLTMMRVFGDMSMIAACMQQTVKHGVLLPCHGLDYLATNERAVQCVAKSPSLSKDTEFLKCRWVRPTVATACLFVDKLKTTSLTNHTSYESALKNHVSSVHSFSCH